MFEQISVSNVPQPFDPFFWGVGNPCRPSGLPRASYAHEGCPTPDLPNPPNPYNFIVNVGSFTPGVWTREAFKSMGLEGCWIFWGRYTFGTLLTSMCELSEIMKITHLRPYSIQTGGKSVRKKWLQNPQKWHLCMEPGSFQSYEIIMFFFGSKKHKNQRCFPQWLLRGFLVGIILWHLSAGNF